MRRGAGPRSFLRRSLVISESRRHRRAVSEWRALSADFFQPEWHRDDQRLVDAAGGAVTGGPVDTGKDRRTD